MARAEAEAAAWSGAARMQRSGKEAGGKARRGSAALAKAKHNSELDSATNQGATQGGEVRTWLRNGEDFVVPEVDWSRYYISVLFVDRTHTTRARLAEGLLERLAAWRGYGRAIYPSSCGTHVPDSGEKVPWETQAGLLAALGPLRISSQIVTAPRVRFEARDLDDHNLVIVVDEATREAVDEAVARSDDPARYEALARERVWLLGHFVAYHNWDAIVAEKGGSAQLDRKLRKMVATCKESTLAMQTRNVRQVSLKETSKSQWDDVMGHTLMASVGLASFLVDSSSNMPFEQWLEY